MKRTIGLAIIVFITGIFTHCQKDKDEDDTGHNGGGNNPGSFKITGVSPEYIFWGEELTLTGTGFSTNKADYTFKFISDAQSCIENFQTTIISVTATQLKIKSPISTYANSLIKCGPNGINVIVTAKGKSDTAQGVKMVGWPSLTGVCYHYGGYTGNYLIPGDSAIIDMAGATGTYATVNNAHQNAKLYINGQLQNFVWRKSGSSCSGGAVELDAKVFGVRKKPTDPDWNNGWRLLPVELKVPNTDRVAKMDLLVTWLPDQEFHSISGPSAVSKSEGGNPFWTIKGKNMYYEKARFVPLTCAGIAQDVSFTGSVGFYDEEKLYMPLSILLAPCTYNVVLMAGDGENRVIGSIKVNP